LPKGRRSIVISKVDWKELCMKLHYTMSFGLALALAGCLGGQEKSGTEGSRTGETGLAISAAANSGDNTDVALMKYSIDRIACVDGEKVDPLNRTITVRLEKMMLPGGIPAFEDSPLDQSSAHPFADHFEILPAGCYNVNAIPLTKGGDQSTDCAAAWAQGVQVLDGQTTEIFLISQCKGTAVGAVDTTVAFNQPPTLERLNYNPSKFINTGDTEVICVTASDPNGDPVSFTWTQVGDAVCDTPVVIANQKNGDSTTECVSLTPKDAGSFWFEVTIYDLLYDENDALIPYEQWLRVHGYPNDSHDSLRFPLYVAQRIGVEGSGPVREPVMP
jgi:hypothetical protein